MTPPFQEKAWQKILDVHTIDFANVYLQTIKLMADRKLTEFNFKVLHLILTCGLNLKRWGKGDNGLCKICNVPYDIPHLLFFCTKAMIVWNFISHIFNLNISLKDIIIAKMETLMFLTIIGYVI